MKILALDFGLKRVGYAVGDDESHMAFPRKTILYTSQKKLIEKLGEIARTENTAKIIIGIPLNDENKKTDAAQKIINFGKKLFRELLIAIEYVDEYGSTDEALSKIPFRQDRKKRMGYADAVAAQIILQRYLDIDGARDRD